MEESLTVAKMLEGKLTVDKQLSFGVYRAVETVGSQHGGLAVITRNVDLEKQRAVNGERASRRERERKRARGGTSKVSAATGDIFPHHQHPQPTSVFAKSPT